MSTVLEPSASRLTELFLTLTRLASPSREERAVADLVISALEAAGVTVHEDDTAGKIGGDTGNLWCVVRPTDVPERPSRDSGPHVAFGAHLDTVAPTDVIEPYLDDEKVFRNRRRTILGADDKAAICTLLHATELLRGSGRPFPPYELFFTVSEETGLVGAKHFDAGVLGSPFAVVLDSSGPVGGITVRAPSQQSMRATFRGRAAHAGVEQIGRAHV